MDIKTLVSATAIVLAATIGSAFAADQFSTLDGVTAKQMTSGDLANVKGQGFHFATGTFGTPQFKVHTLGNPNQGVQGLNGISTVVANGNSPAISIPM